MPSLRRTVIINLGRRLPAASSSQPGRSGRAPLALPYLALLRAGFGRPPVHTEAGGLLPHHFTLIPSLKETVCFCSTFRRVTPPGRYPARCPLELGPSSPSLERRSDHPACWTKTQYTSAAGTPPPVLVTAVQRQIRQFIGSLVLRPGHGADRESVELTAKL